MAIRSAPRGAERLPGGSDVDTRALYTFHFGLAECPFSITPDPRYLFMSERHREALAHLLFGVHEGGSIVKLTGEVGTGKTTLCRYLLEQLPPQVDIALILNPRLTALELLATICDELTIPYPLGTTSLKCLVDTLYEHLLNAHARGRRTVLIIDEAQNLTTEVLEQVRLLTNLETATEKLLQVILIGQPELIPLLNRQKLRQLAQRITARYHLLPFSMPETRAYIRHRLAVAGLTRGIFSGAAMRHVHRASGGVPRLINVICDRALLGAYAQDKQRIDAGTVRRAATEVRGRVSGYRHVRPMVWVPALACLGLAIVGAWAVRSWEPFTRLPSAAKPLVTQTRPPLAVQAEAPPVVPVVSARDESDRDPVGRRPDAVAGPEFTVSPAGASQPPASKLAEVLSDSSIRSDKRSAFARLYARWGLEYPNAESGLGCERERLQGLACLFRTGTWKKLRRFNLPAIIELVAPNGTRHYATVAALGSQNATLEFGGREFTFPVGEIDSFWDGAFILLWNPLGLHAIPIRPGSRGRDIEWLRERLAELDGKPAARNHKDVYDDELKARVVAFQRSRSLIPDGVVAEETLTHLAIALGDRRIPAVSRTATP
ncbi:MAG: AAA family ATPase [Candidatus Rokuibacteriota bacterium]